MSVSRGSFMRMMFVLCVFLAAVGSAFAQAANLQIGWKFLPDKEAKYAITNPPSKAEAWRPVAVDRSWNAQFPDLRDYMGAAWYSNQITVDKPLGSKRALLRFGAVDYAAEVLVNGRAMGKHEGGYTPFSVDVTAALHPGNNDVLVHVIDPPMSGPTAERYPNMRYNEIPHGKQDWYVQTGGIWQPVQFEIKPATYIERVHVTPQNDGNLAASIRIAGARAGAVHRVNVSVRDGADKVVATATGQGSGDELVVRTRVVSPLLWSTDTPTLYTAEVSLDGTVDRHVERFGFRSFEAKNGELFLNGKPFYMIAALDQDFYPDTIYTPPSKEYVRDQMLKGKRMGLNVLRCHIKVCDPNYLEAADEVGMLVWYEIPSWDGGSHFTDKAAARGEQTFREMVERDWNHPSIVIQSIINESWGADLKQANQRDWLKAAYGRAKQATAPLGRLIVDNSACCGNFHVKTDLDDFHQYYSIPDNRQKWDAWVADFASRPKWSFSRFGDGERTGQEPLIVSEFGNWGLPKLPKELPWWFERDFGGRSLTRPAGVQSRFSDYKFETIYPDYNALAEATQWHQFDSLKHEIEEIRSHGPIQGYVITEFTDINWEVNGLMDMWRNPKVYANKLALIQQPDVLLARLPKRNNYVSESVQFPVLVSHYSSQSWRGAKVSWRTSQGVAGNFVVPEEIAAASVAQAGTVSFQTGVVAKPSIVTIDIEAVAVDGKKLAENSYELYVYPRPQAAIERVALVGSGEQISVLRARLAERGVAVSAEPKPGSVLVASAWDEQVERFARTGGRVVLLANSSDAIPSNWPIKVVARDGSDLDGNWITNFNYVRKSSPLFAPVTIHDILGFEAEAVTPKFVIRQVAPSQYADVLAGVFYGWLHENSALAYQAKVGAGRVLATTFRFDAYAQDPYATALLDNMLKYAASADMNPVAAIEPAKMPGQQAVAQYANPVLPGDYPDPSIIRTGEDFWATATSAEWEPEFPILHSRDLVNWNVVGAVFQQRPTWAVANFWAPEISEYNGKYFVLYTARKRGGPLCVASASADKPQGPYTDYGPLVCQDAGSIDAFSTVDENGRRYLIWKEDGNSRDLPTPIWAQPLSDDGTTLTGERKELIRNDAAWEGKVVEAPFILRRNGYFYLFYSGAGCCGLRCDYALGVARSRSLSGPWEKDPANPIVRGNSAWNCPGHGSVVTDQQGHNYFLFHAYSRKDSVYVGRQGVLDAVAWGADGWPVMNTAKGVSEFAPSPFGVAQKRSLSFEDDFTTEQLRPEWQWPAGHTPVVARGTGNCKGIVLGSDRQSDREPLGAVIARATLSADYTAETAVCLNGGATATSGLAAYGDGNNALGVAVSSSALELWERRNGQRRVVQTMSNVSGMVYIRMSATEGHRFIFSFSSDGNSWRQIGPEMDGLFIPPWDRSVRVALFSQASTGAGAAFEFLRITPTGADMARQQ